MIPVASHQKATLIKAIEDSHGRVEIDHAEATDSNHNWIIVEVPEDEVTYSIDPNGKLTSD